RGGERRLLLFCEIGGCLAQALGLLTLFLSLLARLFLRRLAAVVVVVLFLRGFFVGPRDRRGGGRRGGETDEWTEAGPHRNDSWFERSALAVQIYPAFDSDVRAFLVSRTIHFGDFTHELMSRRAPLVMTRIGTSVSSDSRPV